ncbi:MAG TPA: hypothetical protein VF234_07995, partial [Limnochordia bacterium]
MGTSLLVAVLVGGIAAGCGAALVGRAVEGALRGIVGAEGEYDAIIHVREEAAHTAWKALGSLSRERWPGVRITPSLTVAGTANFLLGLPEGARTTAGYASLEAALQDVPGFTGLTFIVQPAITVRGIHPSLRDDLARRIEALPEVRATWVHGGDLIALLQKDGEGKSLSLARQRQAQQRIQALLDAQRVLTVRRSGGFEDPQRAGERLADQLEGEGLVAGARV